jgi:hypothetical protein
MTIGRIGGPMLKENLIRQGVDLSVETNLLYFDVNNMRLGVNTATPNVAMDINGVTRFSSNLQINGSNIATYAGNGNITLTPNGTGLVRIAYLTANRIPYATTNGAITDSANLTFDGTTLLAANVGFGNINLTGNTISSSNTNGNIVIDPNGTGNIIIDTATANQIFYSGVNKELITNSNLTFDGSNLVLSGNANITTLNVSTISSLTTNGNINLDPNGTGNVLLDTATADRVIFTGANKELLTDSDLQFNGTTLQIGNITASGSVISTTSGNLNLSPSGNNRVVFDITSAIRVPVGDTSERPAAVIGDIRFNTELETLEFYTGYDWSAVQAEIVYLLSDTFNGDGSTAIFALSQTTSSDGAFVTLNGVVQSPGVAYGISGTTLTFSEAPAIGDKIDIRYLTLSNEVALKEIKEGNTRVVVNDLNELANVIINGNLQIQVSESTTKINNSFATTAPVTKTNDFSLADGENFIIVNKIGSTCTVTMPNAASYPGRQVTFKTFQSQFLVSASSNICPIDSATPGTAILTNTSGKWATLVSDGTNWIIMAAN